jgi:hypothetical protein
MTKDEFITKYRDVKVTFASYYKYTFNFIATLPNGDKLVVSAGGDADDIYRWEVTTDPEPVILLDPYCGSVVRDGVTVEEFYDY